LPARCRLAHSQPSLSAAAGASREFACVLTVSDCHADLRLFRRGLVRCTVQVLCPPTPASGAAANKMSEPVAPSSTPLRTGISTEARRFLEERPGGGAYLDPTSGSVTYELTHAGVARLRADNTDAAAAGCARVQAELGTKVEDAVVGGVPVVWVTPRSVRGTEVALYMFGGAFVVGTPEDDLSISARLADELGRRVCAPRYRRAPEHPFPAARDDAMAVYRALQADESCGGVLVVGESAGANLAWGLTLNLARLSDLTPPMAVALLSPWLDLTHGGDSHTTLHYVDPTLSVPYQLDPAAKAYAGGRPTASPDISPLFAELPPGPVSPTIICSATRDLLLSDSLRLASKLSARGDPVELRVADGLWHVFEWYPDIPEAAESVKAIATFLSEHMSGVATAKRPRVR